MPNWCEGNVRLRGTKENIKNFLDNEIVYVKRVGEEYKEFKPFKEETESEYTLSLPNEAFSFYVRNTMRNFFFTNMIQFYWFDTEEYEEGIVVLENFNSAWSLKEQGWADHAKKYGIDIKIFGFERGMEFSQVMEITRHGNVETKTTEYSDWNWDCPCPDLGG